MIVVTKPSTKKTSLAAAAYETISRNIISLAYEPGEHLEEKQLMETLAIGRTPIREALLRLTSEKMVEALPNKGIMVKEITIQDTKAMFEAMKILELGIADLAAGKNLDTLVQEMAAANQKVEKAIAAMSVLDIVEANHQFHMLFARCSRNEYLIQGIAHVRNQAKRLSYLSYANMIESEKPLKAHYDAVVNEHHTMIDCLTARKTEQLKNTIAGHIKSFQQRIVGFMTS